MGSPVTQNCIKVAYIIIATHITTNILISICAYFNTSKKPNTHDFNCLEKEFSCELSVIEISIIRLQTLDATPQIADKDELCSKM